MYAHVCVLMYISAALWEDSEVRLLSYGTVHGLLMSFSGLFLSVLCKNQSRLHPHQFLGLSHFKTYLLI